MQRAKEETKAVLSRLPNNCSFEDIQYHLYVLQKISRGLKDIKEGRFYTHDQVVKRLQKWLGK